MRFSGLSWTKDAKGFFYSRYPEPPAGKALQAALSGQALYYHRVGTPQSEDRLIYERRDLPTWFISGPYTDGSKLCSFSGLTAAESQHWRPTIAPRSSARSPM